MILAVYKKNHKRDRWMIASLPKDIIAAKKDCAAIKVWADKIGFTSAESIIQEFASVDDIPSTLVNVKPETMLYN